MHDVFGLRLRAIRSAVAAIAVLVGCTVLAGCGGDQPPPEFAPPDYSYLSKMRLSVGGLTIEDHSAPSLGPNDLAPTAPVPPSRALQQMAHDRLVAAGNAGSAVFTIDQASITGSPGAALDGHMAVHLDIIGGNGAHAGYAEAHVSHQFIPGSDSAGQGSAAALYSLTQQMMQDMNIELEYQVKRSLRDWLVDAAGEPVANSVEQQVLAPPGAAPVTSLGASPGASPGAPPGAPPPVAMPPGTSTGTPVGTTPLGATPLAPAPVSTPAAPDAVFPAGAPPAADQPVSSPALPAQPAAAPLRSPPPHFLQPPAGASPAPAPTSAPAPTPAPAPAPAGGTN